MLLYAQYENQPCICSFVKSILDIFLLSLLLNVIFWWCNHSSVYKFVLPFSRSCRVRLTDFCHHISFSSFDLFTFYPFIPLSFSPSFLARRGRVRKCSPMHKLGRKPTVRSKILSEDRKMHRNGGGEMYGRHVG